MARQSAARRRHPGRPNPTGVCMSCLARFHVRLTVVPGTRCEFDGNPICGQCGEPHRRDKYANDRSPAFPNGHINEEAKR